MKNLLFTTIITLMSVSFALAQPIIEWQKSFGGSGGEFISSPSIQQTVDGGYIVAGVSDSNDGDVSGNHGGPDYWVVKLSTIGSIEWQKSIGGSGYDYATSIQQTNDGGYIVAGVSDSNDGDVSGNNGGSDFWVVKLTSIGTIVWQKSLGGSGNEYAECIQQTDDGGYIVAGYNASNNGDVSGNHGFTDYWIVKLNSLGAIEWQKSLGGTNSDGAESIHQTSDGGYIVAGYANSINGNVSGNHGGGDYWVVKLTNIGTIEWQKSLGGSNDDMAISIQQTFDGGYVVAGYTTSNDGDVVGNLYDGNIDNWVVKLSSLGTIEWQKLLGGTGGSEITIQQINDGGFIVAGISSMNNGVVSGNHGGLDYWVAKLSSIGTIEWQKSLGGTGNEIAFSTQQTNDGGYIVAGYSDSNDGDVSGNNGGADFWIVKLTSCLLQINTQPASQTINLNNNAQFIVSTSDQLATFQWQTDLGVGYQNLNSVAQYSGTMNDTLTISNVTLANNNQPFRCIISSGSCTDTSAIGVLTVGNITGINYIFQSNLFSVYPNPAQNIINVKADAKLLESVYTIYDNTGKVMQSGKINSENTVIEIGNLSSGIYLFIVGDNLKQKFKVIKQ